MASDGISFKMFTEPFTAGIKSREARMPRAGMWAVREAGRVARRTARPAAPVLKGSTLTHRQLQRVRRQGFNVTAAYTGTAPVPGLLRASITPARRVNQLGRSEFSLKVGPRGPRVHLYAQKIEAQKHYMKLGEAAAWAALPGICNEAFGKVWSHG